MKQQRIVMIGAALVAGAVGLDMALAADQSQSQQRSQQSSQQEGHRDSAFGRVGNQGEGFSEEQTIKGQGQNPESSLKQDLQVTIGGARPVIEGEILKITGEDYVIKDASGSRVLVRVNRDTNMVCTGGGESATLTTGRGRDEQREIPPTAHMEEQGHQQAKDSGQSASQQQARQQEQKGQQIVQEQMQSGQSSPSSSSGQHESEGMQAHDQSAREGHRIGDQSGTQTRSSLGKDSGGDIAVGSGFAVGDQSGCAFKTGDRVKAEVSDLGTVLTMKQITEDAGSQQFMSGQMVPPSGFPGSVSGSGAMMPGEKAAAQQRAQMLKPGSAPAPADLQNPELITRDGTQTAKADAQPKNECEGCKVVRGLVLKSEPKGLVVRDASQQEIRLRIDPKTRMSAFSQPRATTFMEGDRVEAVVTPDGYAWSVIGLKQQQGQPGIVGAPGD